MAPLLRYFVRAGREWVLGRAKAAKLNLPASPAPTLIDWEQQLAAARQTLGIRGLMPSALNLQTIGGVESSSLRSVPEALTGVGAGITHLTIRLGGGGPYGEDFRRFLHEMVSALPNLCSLDFNHDSCALPQPTHLPQLTALSAIMPTFDQHQIVSRVEDSVSALLTQLRSLSLREHMPQDVSWHVGSRIFAQRSQTLTQLTLQRALLNDQLVGLLLQHAPALQQLSVGSVSLEADHMDRQWQVKQFGVIRQPSMEQLARLPGSTCQGRVQIAMRADWVRLDARADFVVDAQVRHSTDTLTQHIYSHKVAFAYVATCVPHAWILPHACHIRG